MQADHGEAKKEFAHEIAIEHDCRSGERARSKRENVRSNQAITKPFRVSFKSLDLPEQVMRKSDRLGALEMRVTRHHNIDVFFGEVEQRSPQISQAR